MMIIPLFVGVLTIPGEAGFLPSTVWISCFGISDILDRLKKSFPSLHSLAKKTLRKSQESILDHGGINLLHLHLLKQMLVQIYFKK